MTDATLPTPEPADSLPTEPLQLADQQPVDTAPAPEPAAAASAGSKHTVLAVVGGALAVGLLALVGVLGFAIGHVTADGRDGDRLTGDRLAVQDDARAGDADRGTMPGQGTDPRGIDPDGDNWTGGRDQGGDQGTMPTTPTTPQPETNSSAA